MNRKTILNVPNTREASLRGEEVLRTTHLPEDVLAGTKLFLTFEGDVGQYVVRTRFQDFFRSRKGLEPNTPQASRALSQAGKVFENIVMGDLPGRRASLENPMSNRSALIRLASELPQGSEERRAILAELTKEAAPMKEAAGVSPILASVDQYSVWLHCKVTGYGRIYGICKDLKDAESKLHAAAMAVQKAISNIDGVFPDVWDSYADTAPGRSLVIFQKVKLSGGVAPEQEAQVFSMIKDHVREVKGMAALPKTLS